MICWSLDRLFRFTCYNCGGKWEVFNWGGWFSSNTRQRPVKCPFCGITESPITMQEACKEYPRLSTYTGPERRKSKILKDGSIMSIEPDAK